MYGKQIAQYYALPEERRVKQSLTFSPSSAGDCSRQIFYGLTNAETDPQEQRIPFQSRYPRVGDGLHTVNQEDAVAMPDALVRRGIRPTWRVKTLDGGTPAIEAGYERTFTVDGTPVTIKGRLDAIIQFISDDGEITDEAILDYKVKMQMGKLSNSSILREIDKYRPQMTCYTLLTDIGNVLIEFESAQKPKWSDGVDAKPDERYIHLVPTDAERDDVLQKFASIIRCIQDGTVPEPRRDYGCTFCRYKTVCNRDGD